MNLKGKRTLIVALIIEILGVLEAFEWTLFFGPNAGKVMLIFGLLLTIARITFGSELIKSLSGGGGSIPATDDEEDKP